MVPWPHRVGISPRPGSGHVDLRRSIGFGSKRVASANQSRPWESLVSALVGLPGVVFRRLGPLTMQTMGIEVSATRTPELSQRAQARGRNAMDSPPKSGKSQIFLLATDSNPQIEARFVAAQGACPRRRRWRMAAVATLDDLFAGSAILLLRGSRLRLGECLDLELGRIADYGPTGTWLRVPLGKLGTERADPLDSVTVAALDAWAQHRGQQRPTRTRAPASPPTSCSPSTAYGSAPGGSARACALPPRRPGWPGLAGGHST
jgi:hypothetical protein